MPRPSPEQSKSSNVMSQLLQLLRSETSLSARELCAALSVSQATISRHIRTAIAEGDVLALGEGRKTRYALKRSIAEVGWNIPVYAIGSDGHERHLADLWAVGARGFYVHAVAPCIESGTYESLPYWLNDLRPAGFLGHLIPRRLTDYPADIRLWSDDTCIHYLCHHGWDSVGNIMLGEPAYKLYKRAVLADVSAIREGTEEEAYEKCAADTVALGVAGSSTGGEQPKFVVFKGDHGRPCIVKFSPPASGAASERRRDLLICEHLVHQVLLAHQIEAVESTLVQGPSRVFLEMRRFDRGADMRERRGVLSLGALAEHHLGEAAGDWRTIGRRLLEQQIISNNAYAAIVWRFYFGQYIANSDMHLWNLAFYADGERVGDLTPMYDMLPMAYAPQNEELPVVRFAPPIVPPNDVPLAKGAIEIALEFWNCVASDRRVSDTMRQIAEGCRSACERK